MSRERKLSKWSLTNALSRSRTVVETALYLGVHRDTVYENAKWFDIDIPAVLGSAYDTQPTKPVDPPVDIAPAPGSRVDACPECGAVFNSPGPCIHNSSCNQFPRRTGPDCKGAIANERRADAGRSVNHIGSADDLLYRHARQKH